MSKLLLVVDMQNDFLTGSLRNRKAEDVISKVTERVRHYHNNQNHIVYFTKDTHYDNYNS